MGIFPLVMKGCSSYISYVGKFSISLYRFSPKKPTNSKVKIPIRIPINVNYHITQVSKGRVVAGSNPVIPTLTEKVIIDLVAFFCFKKSSSLGNPLTYLRDSCRRSA